MGTQDEKRMFEDALSYSVGKAFAAFALILLIMIAAGLFVRALPVLTNIEADAFFSNAWHPTQQQFGIFPFIAGTLITTIVGIAIAAPICLLASIYLAEYATKAVRERAGLFIDMLAGVPSVIFGLWGIVFVVPLIREYVGPAFGSQTSGFSILAGGIVLALMVCPIIVSLSVEVLRTVPKGAREASFALGATRAQTLAKVVLPQSSSGLVAAIVLGFSRAIGETMAVMMVVGNVAQYPKGIFDPSYPLTALIANNYGEMMSIPLYDSALMLAALILLIIVLIFNIFARAVLLGMHAKSNARVNSRAARAR